MSITDISIARAERNLENRYQAMIESEDAKQERVNALEAEIRTMLNLQVLAAMSLKDVALPLVQHGQAGRPDREIAQTINEAVMECLDHYEVNAVLHQVLAESTCPIVKELRLAIAKRYVENNAADLAAVRAEE